MIDFHSHILPSIDDGARNIDETIALIKEAKEAGFTDIVLTSHYIENYYETNYEERKMLLDAIKENLSNKNIDINLYLGNEIYISNNIIELLSDGKASTVNNGCYVLFEMPLNSEPMNLYNVIYSLQESRLIPVLAHPERYSFVQKEPQLIYELIEKGVLMQSNYGSILGEYGKKAQFIVRKFLENNMVHFLGSDVHRPKTLYPKVERASEEIKEIIGEEKFKTISTTNPKLAIENKKIDINEPIEFKLTFKEKLMMPFMR